MKTAILTLGKIIILFKRTTEWFVKKVQISSFESCGKNIYIGRSCIFTEKNMVIGDHVYIGPYAVMQATSSKIYIGNNVMFGPCVHIHSGNHRHDVVGELMINIKDKIPGSDKDVIIEDDVWIGAGAIILNGVTIGEGSVIGAGSVINKNVPPYTIIVGSPPKKLKPRWTTDLIDKHKQILKNNAY